MLYHLFKYLGAAYDIPGARLFDYISFRAGMGVVLSLLIGIVIGKRVILLLKRKTIGEDIRDLGLEGQMQKKGTPTMGGIIILISILVPVLLFANLTNMYTWLMIITLVGLSFLGFLDDYIKVFKKNKKGLRGGFKIAGQALIGITVSMTLYLHGDFVVRERTLPTAPNAQRVVIGSGENTRAVYVGKPQKNTITTIPFFKNNEFDYKMLVPSFLGEHAETAGWIVFMIVCIFVIMAVSNGANLTDGMDGLATGVSIFIGTTLGILAYLSNNIIYADYLQIMYIPNSGEVVVFMAAVVGALIGFLWYNTYPSQVFMGDTGSLALGGVIAVCAIIIRKELLIPILCGIFLAESCSVIIQVTYFKYTKRKYGAGRRVFLMSPLHHHYQKKGFHETKIVVRFCIVAALLAIVTILTLKVR
ncbi:phospho-N-acetylmuramoyl-pentapeptide-transferase [Bacteroidia bacterium]|nr:phospho-N-acetylmuramoyl-pentapeptide-transferase [Bacteroidia bacterium]